MKTTNLPLICGVALTAITTAGISHWWSVHQFVTAIDLGLPVITSPAAAPSPAGMPSKTRPAKQPMLAKKSKATPTPSASPDQKDFYEALITKMERLQNQNRDLLDQVAETNRDVMKLNFRVDTHSESFRPLPVTEDRPFATIFDDSPGVLPPRAEAVMLPTQ